MLRERLLQGVHQDDVHDPHLQHERLYELRVLIYFLVLEHDDLFLLGLYDHDVLRVWRLPQGMHPVLLLY